MINGTPEGRNPGLGAGKFGKQGSREEGGQIEECK
jgi:hypothetical protein